MSKKGKDKMQKKLKAVLLIVVLIITSATVKLVYNSYTRPPKLCYKNFGYFPLYEKGFSKTISIQQPNLLRLESRIITSSRFVAELGFVVLKLERLKNGKLVDIKTIKLEGLKTNMIEDIKTNQDNSFTERLEKSNHANHCITNVFIFPSISIDDYSLNNESSFKFDYLEKAVYRITVVQPCDKYECLLTELGGILHY